MKNNNIPLENENFFVAPHSIEAEKSVLGGLLLNSSDNDTWDEISEIITENDFYSGIHKNIFKAISELNNKGLKADVLTVDDYLKREGKEQESANKPYLATLALHYMSVSNIKAYAKIIKNASLGRGMIKASQKILDAAYTTQFSSDESTLEFIQRAEQEISNVSEANKSSMDGVKDIKDILGETLKSIDEASKRDDGLTGQATGFKDLDRMTSGLSGGDMIIIAARPSMGKTTLAMNIVERVTHLSKKTAAVFSLEMSAIELNKRMIASVGGVELNKVISGGPFNDLENKYLSSAVVQLGNSKIKIVDEGITTTSRIRSICRKIQKESGDLGLIVIDYLQLMSGNSTKEQSTNEKVSGISRELKLLARELKVPVIVLSQLNRGLESRPNKRPIMSDLRDSGAIEQDADKIFFVYRDEVYNDDSQDKGTAEIIVAKHRNGPIGTVRLSFEGKYTRFNNLSSRPFEERFL